MAAANRAFNTQMRSVCWIATLMAALVSHAHAMEGYTLSEPATDARVKAVDMRVKINGKVITSAGPGKNVTHEQAASAEYRFLERRLIGAGRDAEAYRCLRDFERAAVRKTISKRVTTQSLPRDVSLIVSHGNRSGMVRYSPNDLLTRDELDLLNVPGDPLAIIPLLPPREVEVGEEWEVPDWAVQMLAALEAASTAKMTGRLADVSDRIARVEFDGRADGARDGALSKVTLSGHLLYDLDQQLITAVDLKHAEKSSVGSVTTGLDSEARVLIDRSLATSEGVLTNEVAESTPLEPPADRLPLRFDAPPWGLQLVHSRGWHVFHAVFDSEPQFVILRLIDQGAVICQCNFSPVPSAAAGEHTPLDEYEESIQQSLGARFGAIVTRDQIPTQDGRRIFRVTVQGTGEFREKEEVETRPMSWIYYLCVVPSGRQVSFVFAVEPAMKERLAGQDRQIVESLEFIGDE